MAKKNGKDTAPAVRTVYLAGFMCAGKSSAGRLLARALRVPFRDTDAAVRKRAGASIAELVRRRGLAAFRRLEAAAVRELGAAGGVVALGGGVYPSRRWRAFLRRTGVTVFLRVPWPELEARLKANAAGRPLLRGRWPAAAVRARKLYERRLAYYRLADITVDAAGLRPAAAARLVKKEL